jgi:hypothetical protein
MFLDVHPYRFDGVVGYHVRLTHERSPVRARIEPTYIFEELMRQTEEQQQEVTTIAFIQDFGCGGGDGELDLARKT